MRNCCLVVAVFLGALGLLGCGAGGSSIASSSYNPGYGPFDANGNYVEAWADKPAKKHWWARKPDPAPTATAKKTTTAKKPSPTKKPEPVIAKNTTSSKPPRSSYSRAPGSVMSSYPRGAVASAPKPAPKPIASTPKPQPKPRPVASTPKPKPKPVAVKPKKPAPRRHVVKKGDTLYGLSRKYGTSVSAIQRANGLKGTTIMRGKTLLIPR